MRREQPIDIAKTVQEYREQLAYLANELATRSTPLSPLEAREIVDLADVRLQTVEDALHDQVRPVPRTRFRRVMARGPSWMKPRIGVLRHHAPRPLTVPARYLRTAPPDPPPSISIVTPSFEQGRFLEKTLYSVVSQNYPALEYVVQDGASSDNTLDVLQRFGPALTSWTSEPDDGQADAINRAFRQTTGEVMAWLNSDDLLLPGSLAYVARYFAEHPDVDVVYGHRLMIDENDGQIGAWVLPAHDDHALSLADYVPQETLFWRRRVWETVGGSVDRSFDFALDWDLLLRFRGSGARMVRLPRFLGAFRVHAEQKTTAVGALGEVECDRLRQRVHGRPVEIEEVLLGLRWYLVKHILVHTRHRIVDGLVLRRARVRTVAGEEWLSTQEAEQQSLELLSPGSAQAALVTPLAPRGDGVPVAVERLPLVVEKLDGAMPSVFGRNPEASVGVGREAAVERTCLPDISDVALVGLWHLGSVAAAAWTATGRSVRAWDPDPGLGSGIAGARAAVAEPGLDEALRSALERGLLRVVDDAAQAIASARVTHLAYDTQVGPSGHPDDGRLAAAVDTFAATAPDGALLLVSSQLPVGTCQGWRDLLCAQERGLLLAYAPENLRLGRALEDLLCPDRLLIGADDDEAFERAVDALAPFSASPVRVGLAAAEMVKHATNTYLALCVAFANDLAWLSLSAGADPSEVAAGLRADPRVSRSAPLRPGPAFSGATLMRDVVTLRALGERCGRPELFAAIIDANERHAELALTWLEDSLGSLRGTRLAVAGLTYKAGTSTLRDSLPLRLVSQLLERGATVTAWDPAAEYFEPPSGVTRVESLEACVHEVDALAVMTALPQLEHVDWRLLRPARRLVVDGCMGVDREAAEAAGWTYRGLAGA